MKNGVYSVILMLSLTGCAALDVKVPLATIKSPELPKKKQSQINFSAEPTKTIITTNDASSRPPTFINTVTNSAVLAADYNYSFLDDLMIGGGLNSDSGLNFQLHYQLLKSSMWSSAIYLTAQYDSTNRTGNQSGTFGAGGYPWKGTLVAMNTGSGLSFGYRFNENFLTYLGFGYNSFTTNSKIEQSPSSDLSNMGGNYQLSTAGFSSAVGLGLQIDFSRVHLKPVVQWVDFHHEGVVEQSVLGFLTVSIHTN